MPVGYMPERKIQFVSLPEFDEIERSQFDREVDLLYDKIAGQLNNEIAMILTFKEYSRTGARHEYEVHCTVDAPGIKAHVEKKGWVKLPTIHDCLKAMEREIEKKVRKRREA